MSTGSSEWEMGWKKKHWTSEKALLKKINELNYKINWITDINTQLKEKIHQLNKREIVRLKIDLAEVKMKTNQLEMELARMKIQLSSVKKPKISIQVKNSKKHIQIREKYIRRISR